MNDFPFALERQIGRGSYATVWLATHRATDSQYAIKVVSGWSRNQTSAHDALLSEIRFVARSAHPNILQVYAMGTPATSIKQGSKTVIAAGQPFLVSEFAPGGSLDSHQLPLPWSSVRSILLDILSALARTHARGIVHLDLKPGNILIGRKGILLADFGIAQSQYLNRPPTSEHVVTGTPNYMAPEQIDGHLHLFGPWTDLYAVGCLAYRLLTGDNAFHGEHALAVLREHKRTPFPRLSPDLQVPPGLDDWIQKLTTKPWNLRFGRASTAARYLAALGSNTQGQSPAFQLTQHELRISSDTTGPDATLIAPSPEHLRAKRFDTSGLPAINREHLPQELPPAPHLPSTIKRGFGRGLVGFEDCHLFGRSQEQEALWSHLVHAVNHTKSSFIELMAPPGAGKSALADWLSTRAHESLDAETLWISHDIIPSPFDGFAGALGTFFSLHHEDSTDFLKRVAQRLALPDNEPLCEGLATLMQQDYVDESVAGGGDAISLSNRHQATLNFLNYLGERRPLVIIVDDAQWAADTLRILRLCFEGLSLPPVHLVCTRNTRCRGSDERAIRLLGEIQSASRGHQINLAPLSTDALAEWAWAATGKPAHETLSLQRASDGNALSMKAILATKILGEDTAEALTHPSVASLVARRYAMWTSQADANTVQALQLVAVLGQRVTLGDWLRLAERIIQAPSLDMLQPAVQEQFIEIVQNERIAFRHGGFRDAVLATISADKSRHTFHIAAAESLKAFHLDDEKQPKALILSPIYKRIAIHYELAGAFDEASQHHYEAALASRDESDFENMRPNLLAAANAFRHARLDKGSIRWVWIETMWLIAKRCGGDLQGSERRTDRLCRRLEHQQNDYMLSAALMEKSRLNLVLSGEAASVAPLRLALAAASRSGRLLMEVQMRLELVLRLFSLHEVREIHEHLMILRENCKQPEWQNLGVMVHLQYLRREAGFAMLTGDYDNALIHAKGALQHVQLHPSRAARSECELTLARVLMRMGDRARADEHLSNALREHRACSDRETHELPVQQCVFALNNGRKADAFEMAERHAIHSTELSADEQRVIDLLAMIGRFENGLEIDQLKLDAAMVRAADVETLNIDIADILLHVTEACIQLNAAPISALCIPRLETFVAGAAGSPLNRQVQAVKRRIQDFLPPSA